MTPSEFKAFLEGMDVKDAPTPEQWARIVEKIEVLEGHGGGAPLDSGKFKYPQWTYTAYPAGGTGDVQSPYPGTTCVGVEAIQ